MSIIGIDLGTTNSLVAVIRDGLPVTLANEMGEHLTPSAVAMAEDGAILAGRAAWDRLVRAPDSGKAFFKRDMGTPTTYKLSGRRWTPTECSAVILQEMKRVAALHVDGSVERAVITVPAYFRENQRQATIEAAQIAGLGVARIINEPTAAALAYGFGDAGKESQLLVFDLGGGTYDVTVLNIFSGVIEVCASGGESHLGGEDFTDALLDRLLGQCGMDRKHPELSRMRQDVESVKRRLSTNRRAATVLAGYELVISRADLEAASAELIARLRPVLKRCLRDAETTCEELEEVLLVGGASRMHHVREFIQAELGREGRHLLDPDRVVAQGAAVQASLCEGDLGIDDIILTDVSAHTLGISVSKELVPGHHEPGYFEPLIDRNTTVPVSRLKTFNTLHPQQDEIIVEVYQGEARMTRDNHPLGKLRVTGLRHRPGQRDPGQVAVRFSYDMNGLLEVEANVLHNRKTFRTVIEERPGALSQKQIEAAMQRLAPLKVHPRDRVHNRARIERANRLYANLKGMEREELSLLMDAFDAALESQDETLWDPAGEQLDMLLSRHTFEEGEWQPSDEEPLA